MSPSSPFTSLPPLDRASAPPAERFPTYPSSWYLFCSAHELQGQTLTRDILGRELVGFRTASGRVAVLNARCSHLNADLGRGRVVGEAIQCPYHHWQYGPDGRCVHIPSQEHIPSFARQKSYPVAERHGLVFFFNGREPLFPLPFFPDCDPDCFAAGKPLHFFGDFSWYMFAANSFDVQHWHLHDRKLLGLPSVDCFQPFARRIRFKAQVTGRSIFDHLTRRFAGDTLEMSITNWGGPLFLVSASFPRLRSYGLVSSQPLGTGQPLRVTVIVLARASRRRLAHIFFEPIRLWVRRLFTKSFVGNEFDELDGIRYSPHTLTESDRILTEYFQWAANLPQEGSLDCQDKTEKGCWGPESDGRSGHNS